MRRAKTNMPGTCISAVRKKMMCIAPYVVSLALAAVVNAQPTYTLREMLNRATDTSDAIQLIELRYKEGQHEKKEYRAAALPYVSMEANVGPSRQSMKTQNQSMDFTGQDSGEGGGPPNSIFQPFGPSREDTVRSWARQEAYALDTAMMSNLSSLTQGFDIPDAQTGTAASWSITAAQPLITFGKVSSALRATRIRDTMLTDIRQYEYDTLYAGIIGAYADAFIAQQNVEVAQKVLDVSERTLQRMQVDYDGGAIPERALLQAKAGHARARANLISARSSKSSAFKTLAEKTGLYPDTVFTLTRPSSEYATATHREKSVTDGLGFKQQQHMLNLQQNQVVYERSKLFPSINLFARVSNQLMFTDDENSPEPGAVVDPDYISYTAGLQLQWTIFDGWRTPSTFQKTRVQKRQTEIRLQRAQRQMKIGADKIESSLSSLESMLEAVELQREAAQRAYEATQTDFERGAANITTLLETEKEWLSAEKQYNELYTRKISLATQLKLLLGTPVYKKGM